METVMFEMENCYCSLSESEGLRLKKENARRCMREGVVWSEVVSLRREFKYRMVKVLLLQHAQLSECSHWMERAKLKWRGALSWCEHCTHHDSLSTKAKREARAVLRTRQSQWAGCTWVSAQCWRGVVMLTGSHATVEFS